MYCACPFLFTHIVTTKWILLLKYVHLLTVQHQLDMRVSPDSHAFRVRVWLHETKVRYGTIIIIATLNKYFIIQVSRHCTCETLNNLCQYTIIVQYLAM